MVQHGASIASGSTMLDVACGGGRHARHFAARGVRVTAVDHDAAALALLRGIAGITPERHDLEAAPWPYPPASFATVLVCHYLWRSALPALLSTVAPGGLLLYETFMVGNERYGRPSRPDFLLRENELLEHTREQFRVLAYEEGAEHAHDGAIVAVKQKIAAIRR
ncbi:MAG: class I SAM-dependent methyltransferase [Burkholderiales bacterium]|nr:class I SAM-dependent methyltransferase [Burkholderiales bacterium]